MTRIQWSISSMIRRLLIFVYIVIVSGIGNVTPVRYTLLDNNEGF
jgi:hypothetical protein